MARKKKEKKQKTLSIITVNNYGTDNCLIKDKVLTVVKKLTYKNNHYYATYLANKDMIIAPIQVSSSIEDEDLNGLIEDRAYDELGLDPALEYLIRYQEIESTVNTGDSGTTYQLFVIEKNKFIETVEELRNQIKYIDLIMPAPLLFQTLYRSEDIAPKGVQSFLYFTMYDTFVTFYKNGKYLYSKSIPFSLTQIYDRYCEMVGVAVDQDAFYKDLQQDGLKSTKPEVQQNLMKLFGEIFISINDIMIYTKRAYDLEGVDRMFIGSDLGDIAGLDEYVQNYLGFHSAPLAFDLDIRTAEWNVDRLHYLMAGSAEEYIKDPDSLINFTLYPKPPEFFKRPSGQITALTGAALVVSLAWPIYLYASASFNDLQTYQLTNEEHELAKDVSKYTRILAQKKREYDSAVVTKEKLATTFSSKEKTLIAIYNKKVHYRLKSDQIIELGQDLINNGVQTNEIESDLDKYSISLVSSSDMRITKLIKDISNKYYDEIVSIDIQNINKDPNSTIYQGILKVELR